MDNRVKNAFVAVLSALLVVTHTVSAEQISLPTVTVSSPAGDAAATTAAQSATADPPKAATNDSKKPVEIQLFYEALCKDSVDFVDHQLLPNYEKYSKFIDITYNPFSQGKIDVDSNNKTVYTCPREQAECDADRVHACAIAHISNPESLLKFVNCSLVEGFQTKIVPIESCGTKSDVTTEIVSQITACFNGSEGYSFLSGYKEKATAAKVVYVPHIIVNKVYSDEIQKLAQEDLLKVICKYVGSEELSECKDKPNGSPAVVVGVLPIFISAFYIIKMF